MDSYRMTREEAVWTLREAVDEAFGAGIEIITRDGGEAIKMAIEALVERKTGRWISDNPFVEKITFDESGCVSNSCHCSECGDWLTASDEYPCRGYYCPNCGAKMEAEE